LAILENLEEKFPEPPLLPTDAQAKAWVCGIALINAADSHPLIVPRVPHYLSDVLKVSDEQRLAWIQHWLGAGLQAIETLLAEHSSSGYFCHGDRPTIADICLVTQITPAKTLTSRSTLILVSSASMTIAWQSLLSPMLTQQGSRTRNRGVGSYGPIFCCCVPDLDVN